MANNTKEQNDECKESPLSIPDPPIDPLDLFLEFDEHDLDQLSESDVNIDLLDDKEETLPAAPPNDCSKTKKTSRSSGQLGNDFVEQANTAPQNDTDNSFSIVGKKIDVPSDVAQYQQHGILEKSKIITAPTNHVVSNDHSCTSTSVNPCAAVASTTRNKFVRKRKNRARKTPNPHPPKSNDSIAFTTTTTTAKAPTNKDVLYGRGAKANRHWGNQRYHEEKRKLRPKYVDADKNDKSTISQELVDTVHGWGGRFMKLNPKTNAWYEVEDSEARKKAGQTLREENTPQSRAAKRQKFSK